MKSMIWKAMCATSPLIAGMLPFAVAFGTICDAAGIPGRYAIAMSATVYAGLAQFVVVNMYTNGIDNLLLLVGFALLVNLRFTLMGLSLKPIVPPRNTWFDCLVSFGLSDEPYAVVVHRFNTHGYDLVFHVCAYAFVYIFWVAGTAIGVYLSSIIVDPTSLGLEFAMCAAFIVMLIPRLKQWDSIAAAVLSGISVPALTCAGAGEAAIIFASLGSLLAVVFVKRKLLKQKEAA
ncbi:MAG: AzlC family ABC transporter permease [Desulfobacter sp.]